ncbi:FAD-binding oxidoreductase [Motilimonas pumila]|uniref:D-lactate dehydrogenase (cytochrome) n=2 Tax=Motilimonas pumila TaxID=2303987 RepID=A0A418YGN1_9GAMM|nr:FAD-binding oxidoreductase [Motilimonas pumila]
MHRFAAGTDASCYRLVPEVVLILDKEDELQQVLALCRDAKLAVTFRAAGTSLSGQAISNSVLIKLSSAWRGHEILANGDKIRCQPGLIGAQVNRILAPYQRKIGPDPASINTCKIGGIAANNSSGMCCGTAQNSYATVADMRLVLADGSVLDTASQDSIAWFKSHHRRLLDQLESLACSTQQDKDLRELIKHKYRLKNTTGYSLNALTDYQDGIDILKHLMIGSEGTLGFISDITYHTIAQAPFKASSLVVFADIRTSCQAVARLANTEVAAVELMDFASLRSVASQPVIAKHLAAMPEGAAALLLEVHGETEAQLKQEMAYINEQLAPFSLVCDMGFSQDERHCQQLWDIRKGLFPAVGAVREKGTTVIIEDIAVAVENLAEATLSLQQLLAQYGYQEAIIFGHALDGNLHFVFTQDFGSPTQLQRYQLLMTDVVKLVTVEHQGSLKAEHGTGRNMAPFVEQEWGQQALAIMWQIKHWLDPLGILNPDVVLSQDPNIHLKNLKLMPAAAAEVDTCIECGFCEPACPSKDYSLTPRQRISVYRHGQTLAARDAEPQQLAQWQQAFQHSGIDSCAATGMCAQQCPVGINTGELILSLRRAQLKPWQQKLALWSSEHMAGITALARSSLASHDKMKQWLGAKNIARLNQTGHHLAPQLIPILPATLPKSQLTKPQSLLSKAVNEPQPEPAFVYLPSCLNRTCAANGSGDSSQHTDTHDGQDLMSTLTALMTKAGFRIVIPGQVNSLCCGLAFHSKGAQQAHQVSLEQTTTALLQASEQGKWPIVMDASPCAQHLTKYQQAGLTILDAAAFCELYLPQRLDFHPIPEPVMLHVTCSSQNMGQANLLRQLLARCAEEVIEPAQISCCGFAGDRGICVPGLNQAALADLAQQVPKGCQRGYSNSRSCEIGLSLHSGIEYQSVVYLVNQVTTVKNTRAERIYGQKTPE